MRSLATRVRAVCRAFWQLSINQSINQSEITQCLVRLIVPAVYSNGKPILLVSFKDKGLQTAFSPEPCIKQNYNAEMSYFLATAEPLTQRKTAENFLSRQRWETFWSAVGFPHNVLKLAFAHRVHNRVRRKHNSRVSARELASGFSWYFFQRPFKVLQVGSVLEHYWNPWELFHTSFF